MTIETWRYDAVTVPSPPLCEFPVAITASLAGSGVPGVVEGWVRNAGVAMRLVALLEAQERERNVRRDEVADITRRLLRLPDGR
jgi:hypothetical protein